MEGREQQWNLSKDYGFDRLRVSPGFYGEKKWCSHMAEGAGSAEGQAGQKSDRAAQSSEREKGGRSKSRKEKAKKAEQRIKGHQRQKRQKREQTKRGNRCPLPEKRHRCRIEMSADRQGRFAPQGERGLAGYRGIFVRASRRGREIRRGGERSGARGCLPKSPQSKVLPPAMKPASAATAKGQGRHDSERWRRSGRAAREYPVIPAP